MNRRVEVVLVGARCCVVYALVMRSETVLLILLISFLCATVMVTIIGPQYYTKESSYEKKIRKNNAQHTKGALKNPKIYVAIMCIERSGSTWLAIELYQLLYDCV